MKCEICGRRKAKHIGFVIEEWNAVLNICEECRREGWPTIEEAKEDTIQETHRTERQAEFDACYVELNY